MPFGQKDEDLKEALRRKLEKDINLRGYALKGDVVEGEAQLQGIVDVLAEKEHAETIAKNIPGIKKVDNSITISTDGDITNSEVDFEVAEELNANPKVNLKHIGAKSSGGIVTLAGNVTDPEEIEQAHYSASKARGVTKVDSQIKIQAPEMSLDQIFHSQVNNDDDTNDHEMNDDNLK